MSGLYPHRLLSAASSIHEYKALEEWMGDFSIETWAPFTIGTAAEWHRRLHISENLNSASFRTSTHYILDHEEEVWFFGTLEECVSALERIELYCAREIMAQGTAAEGL